MKKKPINAGPTNLKSTRFLDVTEDYGLGKIKGVRFNVVDLNNDGYSDLVVLPDYFAQPQFFYFDSNEKKFKNYSYTPFAKSVKASFLLFYDFNGDEIKDLVVGVLNQKSELTKYSVRFFKGNIINERIWFTELKGKIKATPYPTASASLIDFDLDGKLDLYLGNWFKKDKKDRPTPVPDRIFRNNGKKFSDYSKKLNTELEKNETKESFINATPTFGTSTCDVDDNGFPDILTVSTNGYDNKLWLNEFEFVTKTRTFKDIGEQTRYAKDLEGFHIPRGGGRSFFSSCYDYNYDGKMDIYLGELTHSYDNDSVDRSSILTNIRKENPPLYLRTEYLGDSESFNWSRADKRAIWFDYNFDGKVDLLVDNTGFPPFTRSVLFEQQDNFDFADKSKVNGINILNPIGTVILDIDRDGRMDILMGQSHLRQSNIKQRVWLFKNNIAWEGKRSIRIFPRGTTANSSALGAMVTLVVDKQGKISSRKQWIEYSKGNLPSQNEEGLYYGLDTDEKPLSIKVRWPIYKLKSGVGRSFLETSYKIDGMKFDKTLNLTLCEDGRVFTRKTSCR